MISRFVQRIHQGKITAPTLLSMARVQKTGLISSGWVLSKAFNSSKAFPPHKTINMPALSPTMTSGNLGSWHKKIGDEIVPGDILVEIETDKAQMDFECQEEGFLAKVFIQSGTKDVQVNTPIAVLAERKEDVEAFADFSPVAGGSAGAAQVADAPAETAAPSQVKSQSGSSVTTQESSSRQFVSPIAKKIAKENQVDLSGVAGSGPSGRVIKVDVEKALSSAVTAQPESVKAAPAQVKTQATSSSAQPSGSPISAQSYTDLPLSNMRKVIAARLLESKSTIPHYYLTSNITMDKVLKLRQVFNEQAKEQFKLSVNDFIIKAAALSLKQVPEVNSSWQGDFIRRFNTVDISVAVSTPSGLITPIVFGADAKGLASISSTVKDLANKARENKLSPAEYQGGTFTISNLGMFGVEEFSAIINPPQSCILAIGSTEKVVVPGGEDGAQFSVVNKMKVTLSCDHRVVDGAVGAQWLSKFKFYLENPLSMML